ncbi:hypothetical protein REPUB_Repub18cG0067600 [Reevesia pubescens]
MLTFFFFYCYLRAGIKGLPKLNNLEALDLHGNILGNNILSHLDGFTSLKSLHLQNCGLKRTVDILEIFNNLMNLKELYLGENQIESLGTLFQGNSSTEKGQLRMIKLEVLGLSYNLFNNSIFSSLSILSNLKSLYLGSNKLKGPIHIKELNALSNLEYLDMSYNEVNAFLPSQELRMMNLEVLDLSGNLFNNSIFSSFARLSNLKSLFLDVNKLDGSRDLKVLDALSLEKLYISCSALEGVRINDCSLPPKAVGLFPSSLKTLSLKGFNFNGTRTTQKWQNLTSLEELILEFSSLPSNFIQDIGTLASLKSLRVLDCEINGSLSVHGPLHLKNLESLDIYNTSLENNFLQKIGAMPSLKFLWLSDCGLNGSLDTQGICELTNLQDLYLSYNNLKANLPECFSNLTSLEYLDLSSNQFSGNISALKSLTSLQRLDLSNNNFQIPSSLQPLFNLSNLKYIHADKNSIYFESEMYSLVAPTFQLEEISLSCCGDGGSFPQFFYHQRDLSYVDLSNIKFNGEFPNWLLENNKNLLVLFLANSSLFGPLQHLFHPYLGLLDISNNVFSGNIPIEIGAQLPSLIFLNMSKNNFYGGVPSSIGDMSSLIILDLSNNQLSGGIPEHLAMGCSSLEVLALANNTFQGQLFSRNFNLTNLSLLILKGNNFTRIPDILSNSSSLSIVDISNNQLSGSIPRWMGNMSSLQVISMADNHLEGSMPEELCKLNLQLEFLDLSQNYISGSLPSCFHPSRISQVHLSKNSLQGPLPIAFRDSSSLVTLDLSENHMTGNIPDWIGNLSQLSYLLLKNNHFEGEIPIQLCKLAHLSLIDLSQNTLSGGIPPCLKVTALNYVISHYDRSFQLPLGNRNNSISIEEPIEYTIKSISYFYNGRTLANMSGIDLSCNKLIGEIPHETENFRMLFALNLSHNSLTGPIPRALSDLVQIESLDLSYNNLSGNIPLGLAELNFLGYFNVSYNNLSGKTPERIGHLATFDESSYVGNLFLCGPLVQKNCSPIESPLTPKASTGNGEDDGSIDMDVFYASFIVSYIMVLLCIAVVLYINPYWRQAWFYHVEMGVNSCYYFLVDNIPKQFRSGNM